MSHEQPEEDGIGSTNELQTTEGVKESADIKTESSKRQPCRLLNYSRWTHLICAS